MHLGAAQAHRRYALPTFYPQVTVLCTALLLGACGSDTTTTIPQNQLTTGDAQLTQRMSTAFKEWARDSGMIGAAVKVHQASSDFQWQDSYGMVSVNLREPYRADTRMRIASATKPMTAVVTLQLVDEGLLSLDDRLSTWFPDYPNGQNITIEQLLQHRSGIYDVTLDDATFQGYVLTNMSLWLEPAEILRWTYAEDLPPIQSLSQNAEIPRGPANAPGEAYHYSQPGFIALGYIIENVTGKPLEVVYAERIFTPLAMSSSEMVSPDIGEHPLSYMYLTQQFGNSLVPTTLFGAFDGIASASWAAGGVISTTNDLMVFFQALLNGELLSESAMALMTDFQVSDPEGYGLTRVGYYGLGFARQIRDGYTMKGHNGSMPGSGSVMQYVEQYDLYITATRNTDAFPENHPDAPAAGVPDLVDSLVRAIEAD